MRCDAEYDRAENVHKKLTVFYIFVNGIAYCLI